MMMPDPESNKAKNRGWIPDEMLTKSAGHASYAIFSSGAVNVKGLRSLRDGISSYRAIYPYLLQARTGMAKRGAISQLEQFGEDFDPMLHGSVDVKREFAAASAAAAAAEAAAAGASQWAPSSSSSADVDPYAHYAAAMSGGGAPAVKAEAEPSGDPYASYAAAMIGGVKAEPNGAGGGASVNLEAPVVKREQDAQAAAALAGLGYEDDEPPPLQKEPARQKRPVKRKRR